MCRNPSMRRASIAGITAWAGAHRIGYGTALMWPPAIRQRPPSEIQTLV